MGGRLRVFPHRSGPWVVAAGERRFSVPPELAAGLLPLDGSRPGRERLSACLTPDRWGGSGSALATRLSEALETSRRGPGRRWPGDFPLWLRLPLMPGPAVGRLAGPLERLTGPRPLAAIAGVGVAGHLLAGSAAAATRPVPGEAGIWAAGLALLLATAFGHELGHAAALGRAGYRPGSLGLGLLVLVPVLYVEVTAVALLPKPGRLRVDVAGPVFQLGLGGGLHLAAASGLLPGPLAGAAAMAAWSSLLAVIWSLWPFVRSDGYWVICDSLEVGNLVSPLGPGRSVFVHRAVCLYRILNAAVLVGLAGGLPWMMARRFGPVWARWSAGVAFGWRLAAILLGIAILAGAWWGIGCRVAMLVRANRRDGGVSPRRSAPAKSGSDAGYRSAC